MTEIENTEYMYCNIQIVFAKEKCMWTPVRKFFSVSIYHERQHNKFLVVARM